MKKKVTYTKAQANERIEKLYTFLNMVGKNTQINAKPIIRELAQLNGIDDVQLFGD